MASKQTAHVIEEKDEDQHGQMNTEPHQKQTEEATSAYVLQWANNEPAKTIINDVDQLRSCLRDAGDVTRHLFFFRGLPVNYGVALRELAYVNSSFIEAHAGRRSYRPRMTSNDKAAAVEWAHYDYPELLDQPSRSREKRQKASSCDLLGNSPIYATSINGGRVAFCRASFWISEKAQTLYLDRAAWDDPGPEVSMMKYKRDSTEEIPEDNKVPIIELLTDPSGSVTLLGENIPDFETIFMNGLPDVYSGNGSILELVEDIAISKWNDVFDMLDLDTPLSSSEATALLSQISGCLERNLNVSRQAHKMRHTSTNVQPGTYPFMSAASQQPQLFGEWEALLSRLSRRAQLLAYLKPIAASPAETPVPKRKQPDPEEAVVAGMGLPLIGSRDPEPKYHRIDSDPSDGNTSKPSNNDEYQRSANRVAYIGGILLPFSIVSGILAIEDPYGPGDPQFWIFWAVTLPLALITLAVVYADSIRTSEVWVQVSMMAAATPKPRPLPQRKNALPSRMTLGDVLVPVPVEVEVETGESSAGFGGDTVSSHDVEMALPVPVPVMGRIAVPESLSLSISDDDDSIRYNLNRRVPRKEWRKVKLGWGGAFANLLGLQRTYLQRSLAVSKQGRPRRDREDSFD